MQGVYAITMLHPDFPKIDAICNLCMCADQWKSSASTKDSTSSEACNYSASSSRWNTAWKRALRVQLVLLEISIRGCTSATNITTSRRVAPLSLIRSSFTSAKYHAVSNAQCLKSKQTVSQQPKTSQYITQCKVDISHAFKTAKKHCVWPMMCKSPDLLLNTSC